MSKARVMVVGAVGSGKTTLIQSLNRDTAVVSKTQSLEYRQFTIDTPGEFMENPYYYRALFATSLEVQMVLFIQDATKQRSIFPPGFAGAFCKMTVGVVSKIDHPEARVEQAEKYLQDLGLSGPILSVSAFTQQGMESLREILNWN